MLLKPLNVGLKFGLDLSLRSKNRINLSNINRNYNTLISSSLLLVNNNNNNNHNLNYFSTKAKRANNTTFSQTQGTKSGPIKNEDIKQASVRVVYIDPETNENAWKIMEIKEALEFAKSQSLDLILVNDKIEPHVCKLDNFGEVLMNQKKKEKERKAVQKSRTLKEMFCSVGIGIADLDMKMNKVREFLSLGHPVKVVIMAKKGRFKKNPLALSELTLVVLEMLENDVSTVQEPSKSTTHRVDFLFNPKSKVDK
jgi:translation initiation factor IF-3